MLLPLDCPLLYGTRDASADYGGAGGREDPARTQQQSRPDRPVPPLATREMTTAAVRSARADLAEPVPGQRARSRGNAGTAFNADCAVLLLAATAAGMYWYFCGCCCCCFCCCCHYWCFYYWCRCCCCAGYYRRRNRAFGDRGRAAEWGPWFFVICREHASWPVAPVLSFFCFFFDLSLLIVLSLCELSFSCPSDGRWPCPWSPSAVSLSVSHPPVCTAENPRRRWPPPLRGFAAARPEEAFAAAKKRKTKNEKNEIKKIANQTQKSPTWGCGSS